MFRSIRRQMVILAVGSMLAASSGAEAGLLTSLSSLAISRTGLTLTANTCPAVTPVVYATNVSVPSAGSGASCTNDTQCNGLDEACVFPPGAGPSGGFCSASGLLTRGGISYVAGTLVDVDLTIPDCTTVSTVDGVPLGGYGGFDGQAAPVSWTFLPNGAPTTVNGQPAIRQRIRVTIPNAGDGTSGSMSIQVAARTGGATTTTSFPLVQVAAVDAAMHSTVAERRIRNSYVASVYHQFGDYDQAWTDDGTRIYGVDWSELSIDAYGFHHGTDMRIQEGQVAFSMQFMADKPGCDPDVYVDGTFRLVPDGDSVRLDWIHPPRAEADSSGVCGPLTLGIYEFIVDGFADEDAIAAPFAKTISAGFGADDDGRIKVCDFCRVSDVRIGGGKIEIWTVPPAESVRVKVQTVRGTDVTADPTLGIQIPAGFIVPIAGGGSFGACVAPDGIPGSCDSLVADVDGAFNWWGSDVPVPDSIACNQYGVCAVLGGRANARARLKGVLRHTDELPAHGFTADSLIARRTASDVFTGTPRMQVKSGCVVPTSASDYRVAIGVNEKPWAPPLRGRLDATLLLAQNADQSRTLFGGSTACPAEASTGGYRATTTGTLTTLAR